MTFWGDCILHAFFLINRHPLAILRNRTPYEILHNMAPDLTSLHVFGCLSYARTAASPTTKFDPRGRRTCFLDIHMP